MNNIIYVGCPTDEEENILHSHKGYEIKFCANDGKITANDQQYIVNKGDFAVIPLLLKHTYNGDINGNLTILLEQALLPIKEVTVISGEKAYGLGEACTQASYFFNDSGKDNAKILSALGDLIVAYIVTYSNDKRFSPAVKNLIAEIDKNISSVSFSLEACIRALPLNYDYVRKLFKREVGITPHEYLSNARMELARNIILSRMTNQYSNFTVSQIAEMCGFLEPLYFSRVFKKYFGVSPTEFISNNNGAYTE